MPYILYKIKKGSGPWKRSGTPFLFTAEEVRNVAHNSPKGEQYKFQNTTSRRIITLKGSK